MQKGLVHIGAPLVCGALLLLGVVALNSLLRDHFHDDARTRIAFSDIDVEPPGKLSREEFLSEVQYLASWPDAVNPLEENFLPRLHGSFAMHPWVETVERVWLEPPRQIHVRLRYRVAVLTIPPNHVVDRSGVLMPQAAADPQLPVLEGTVAPLTKHTGQQWENAGVLRAAAVAALLRPDQEQLQLKRFEIADGLLVLSGKRTRVVWGKVENADGANEPSDELKLQRLFELREKFGTLDGRDVDLRIR